jgi:hypothetical protein
MKIELVNFAKAKEEVEGWLDYKKIRDKKREDFKSSVDNLIDLVQDGVLVVNSDNTITHILNFPIDMGGNNGPVSEIKYKARLEERESRGVLAQLKTGDATDNRLIAKFCALTGQSIGFQGKLDSSDMSIAQEILVFFF